MKIKANTSGIIIFGCLKENTIREFWNWHYITLDWSKHFLLGHGILVVTKLMIIPKNKTKKT